MPGAAIHAFCDPVTTRSRPQSSIANGTAPSAEIASTRSSASGATSRTAAASAAMSLVTPVEVSLWVSSTALRPGIAGRRLAHRRRRAAACAPLDLEPRDRRAVDLGDLREPVAERAHRDGEDRVAGRERVDDRRLERRRCRRRSAGSPRAACRSTASCPRSTRCRSALNSSPRWLTICRPPASRTDGGRAVGPGMRRLGSKRVTAVSWVAGIGPGHACPT